MYSTSSFVCLALHINIFVFQVLRKRPEEEEPKVEPKKVEKIKKPTGRNLSTNLGNYLLTNGHLTKDLPSKNKWR